MKKRRKSTKANRSRQRGVHVIPQKSKRDLLIGRIIRDDRLEKPLAVINDRRFYHPDPYEKIKDRYRYFDALRSRTRASIKKRIRRYTPNYHRLAFDNPLRVKICRQRKQRREILFKKNKAGKGIKGPKKHIRNFASKIICTRRS